MPKKTSADATKPSTAIRPGTLDSQGELTCRHYDDSGVALPETYAHGQGTIGFLMDWYASMPRGVVSKPQPQVLAEFFTSMLILSAEFKYKPAIGANNYLYFIDERWELSLIPPEQWTQQRQDGYAGLCRLLTDRTWTIVPSGQLTEDTPVADAVRRFYDGFRLAMDTDGTLEDVLPFFAGKFSYYRRLNANALSRSIRAATTLSGDRNKPVREWALQLPSARQLLLSNTDGSDSDR
ncbi:MAG: hypothetical protein AAFO81_00880 [Pseudomonadota bacterium]